MCESMKKGESFTTNHHLKEATFSHTLSVLSSVPYKASMVSAWLDFWWNLKQCTTVTREPITPSKIAWFLWEVRHGGAFSYQSSPVVLPNHPFRACLAQNQKCHFSRGNNNNNNTTLVLLSMAMILPRLTFPSCWGVLVDLFLMLL